MSEKKVFIRADSNKTIAGGHISRCLSIAEELMKRGVPVHFLTADDDPSEIIRNSGADLTVLHSDWRDLMTDVNYTRNILSKESDPVLLIDTYSVTKEYVELLSAYCKPVYLGSKQEFLGPLKLLINYSTDIDPDFYRQNYTENTKLLLGSSYVPLRQEFKQTVPEQSVCVKRIMVTTGNSDNYHMTDTLLYHLLPLTEKYNIELHAVIGRHFDNKEELTEKYGRLRNVELHCCVRSMSALMKECDLAVSAGGTTVFEMMALGLPVITFALVPEQVKSAVSMSALGGTDHCGDAFADPESCARLIRERCEYYIKDPRRLSLLSKRSSELVDGNGCRRIADAISAL